MFYYPGRKGRTAASYPAPQYPIVVEPFAGSMAYTLHHRPPFAIGIEADPEIHALWHRLCDMTPADIAAFPEPQPGVLATDRWVLLAITSGQAYRQSRTMNDFTIAQFRKLRALALRHHDYARTSVIYRLGDYREAPDIEATWYLDPPYEGVAEYYRHRITDYDELARWCLTRRGQVIVCAGRHDSWLPFEAHGSNGTMWPQGRIERVLVHRTHRRCEVCATTFPAARADARYCSPRCRQRASRGRREIPESSLEFPGSPAVGQPALATAMAGRRDVAGRDAVETAHTIVRANSIGPLSDVDSPA